MNYDVRMMIEIYATTEFDWLGDVITDLNKLTRHHIIKKEDGGENGISNYALLTPKSHHLMNLLEEQDQDTYNKLNNMFLELNRSIQPPREEYYQKIRHILKTNKLDQHMRRR